MSDKIGLLETISLSVGGMVGGGIFAVLGVVAAGAGTSAWIAFAVSGFIAFSAGFSFVRLNNNCTNLKSPIGQIEDVSGSPRIAGMVGWLLTFGYIGTMAMYAFAFGSYLQGLLGIEHLFSVPTRPIFSVLCIILFGGLNLLGAHTSGKTEDILVISKILILLVFAISGIIYGLTHEGLSLGIKSIGFSSLTVAAISFVAFEGWELLMFDQNSIINPRQTIRKAIYISIFGTTLLYVLVAIVTTNLVSLSTIKENPETALAIAAKPFLGQLGFILIAIAAVISTASALNATLFSASRLSHQISKATSTEPGSKNQKKDSPNQINRKLSAYSESTSTHRSHRDEKTTPPKRTIIVIGVLTSIFTFYGNLNSITSFASGAFMTIFGIVSYLALTQRNSLLTTIIPTIGTIGSITALISLLWHLHKTSPDTLVTVAVIWAIVLSVYWVPKK